MTVDENKGKDAIGDDEDEEEENAFEQNLQEVKQRNDHIELTFDFFEQEFAQMQKDVNKLKGLFDDILD